MTELREGLYESLLTSKLGRQLSASTDLDPILRAVDLAEQPEVLARHVREAAFRTLSAQRDPAKRVELVNALLDVLDQADDAASGDPQQLLSLSRPAAPGRTPLSIVRPAIPLSDAALLTNAPNEPSLGAEVRAELETADQVDLLCAFVKWHGLRVLDSELKRLRERSKPLRVVTTTYMGATERTRAGSAGQGVRRRGQDPVRRRNAPGCTPRRGCSAATPSSTPLTSGRPICRAPPCSTGSSGTSGCPGSRPRR